VNIFLYLNNINFNFLFNIIINYLFIIMATPTTNFFTTTGQDLGQIFKVRVVTDPSGAITGYEYYDTLTSTYKDLNTLFYPYSFGTLSSTQFYSKTGQDLNVVFQGISTAPYSVTTTSGTFTQTTGSPNYVLTFNPGSAAFNPGSFTINFLQSVTINVLAIGGGGGGGGGSETATVSGGGGGSGGIGKIIGFTTGITSYTITVGYKGGAGGGNNSGGDGGSSSFNGASITSTGGIGGAGNYFGGGGGPQGTSSGTGPGFASVAGGKGGDGYPNSATGNGTSATTIPVTLGTYSYSVGGGGGGGNNASKGGTAALNGTRGQYGANTVAPGQNASVTSYGSGAGGGAYSGTPQAGGIGAPGVVIITFTYP
jgi:hypothetical protein